HVVGHYAIAAPDVDASDRLVHAALGLFLIEASLAPAVGTAKQSERANDEMREHAFADGLIEGGEITLADLRFGVECLVGIAERDSRDRIRIRRSARLGSRH